MTTDDPDSLDVVLSQPSSGLTFLCGAGVSHPAPTRLPTVRSFLDQSLEFCGARGTVRAAVLDQYLGQGPIPRFEVIVDEIRRLKDPALRIAQVFAGGLPNDLHCYLAARCAEGACVITTNFDTCIEEATPGRPLHAVTFDGDDLPTRPGTRGVVIKPHGTLGQARQDARSLVMTISAIAQTAAGYQRFPGWRSYLLEAIEDKVLVVVGYSGSDDFDLTPLLLEARPRQIVWVQHSDLVVRPVQADLDDATTNVRRICAGRSTRYFRGPFQAIVPRATRAAPPALSRRTTIDVLGEIFPTRCDRLELLNLLLLLHHQDGHVRKGLGSVRSARTTLQRLQALYRLARYDELFEAVRSLSNATAPRDKAEALYYEAAAHYQFGQLVDAQRLARRQYMMARLSGDHVLRQKSLNNLAAITFGLGRRKRAAALYRGVLSLNSVDPFIEGEATARWGLADCAVALGDYGEALSQYEQAHVLHASLGNRLWAAWLSRNIGELLVDCGEVHAAEPHLLRARHVFTDGQAGSIWTDYSLAKFHFRCGDPVAARERLHRAFTQIGNNLGFPVMPELIALTTLLDDPSGGFHSKLRRQFEGERGKELLRDPDKRWALVRDILLGGGAASALIRERATKLVFAGNA
jgi:tetratricopeptide (TPR) repeat protein